MGVRLADVLKCDAGFGHQVELDRLEVLGLHPQIGFGQQVVDVRDPPGDRVFHRDHREFGVPALHCSEHILEGPAGQWRS